MRITIDISRSKSDNVREVLALMPALLSLWQALFPPRACDVCEKYARAAADAAADASPDARA